MPTMEGAWTLPPNTLCYFRTYESPRSRAGFHFLYIRVKQASKYWDGQWGDIVGEAAEHLSHTDDKQIKYSYCPKGQVIGAYEPYVLLNVGLEVRLFKWEQGFDESVDEEARRKKSPRGLLRELNPGKLLNICEMRDREEIEMFLDKAEQLKEEIQAREAEKKEEEI